MKLKICKEGGNKYNRPWAVYSPGELEPWAIAYWKDHISKYWANIPSVMYSLREWCNGN